MNSSKPQPSRSTSAINLEGKSLGFKVVRGVVFSIVRKLVTGPLFLIIVPFTLHRVGMAGYGTWAILAGLINICWFLDFGLGSTVIKYVAESVGNKDLSQLRRVLDTTSALYCFIATVAVCVLGLGSHIIVRGFFRGDATPPAQVLSLWPLLLLTVASDILARPFGAIINGLQRMDLNNVLLFLRGLSNSLLTVILLLAGARVGGLLWAALLSSLLNLVGCFVITRKLLPSLLPNPLRCDLGILRQISTFSLALFAGLTMTTIQGQLEKFYLARFAGIASAGLYDLASEAASKVRRLPDLLLSPVMAAASELHAADERPKLFELYVRSNKYLAVVAVPFMVFALFTARMLVRVWLGPDMISIAVPFAGLVIGNFFVQLSGPAHAILVGKGVLRPGVYGALIAGGLNIVLSIIFIRQWGFAGAMLGTAIPMIASTAYYFIASSPHLEMPFFQMVASAYLKPLLCSLAAALGMWATPSVGKQPWQNLLLLAAVYGVVYVGGILVTRFFDEFDLARAQNYLPLVGAIRRTIRLQRDVVSGCE
jgi:O-antigen/teichoic acid export membrane protein